MTQPSDIAAEFAKLEGTRTSAWHELEATSARLTGLQTRLASLKSSIKFDEAHIWVNGGAVDIVIDGKNEKLREAQFTLAAGKVISGHYQSLAETETGIEATERSLTNLRLVIRGIDHSMMMKIEQMQWMNTPRFFKEMA